MKASQISQVGALGSRNVLSGIIPAHGKFRGIFFKSCGILSPPV